MHCSSALSVKVGVPETDLLHNRSRWSESCTEAGILANRFSSAASVGRHRLGSGLK